MPEPRRSSAERSLFIAVKSGDLAGVIAALDDGLDIEARDRNQYTPLMQAVICEKLPVVQLLLDRGADIHSTWIDGATALHFSARGESIEITKLLIDRGANPDLNGGGRTGGPPLVYALQADRGEQATFLLSKIAKIDADVGEREWLEVALHEARDSAARALLRSGLRPPPESSIWKDPKIVRLLETEGIKQPGESELLAKSSGLPPGTHGPYQPKSMGPSHPLWRYRALLERIASEANAEFGPVSADELAILQNVGFPDSLLEFYAHYAPRSAGIGNVHLAPVADILIDNTDVIPGCVVARLGYLSFARTISGDPYCFDIHHIAPDGTARVAFFDHEVLGEDATEEDVLRHSVPIADDLYQFLEKFLADDLHLSG